MFYFFFFSSRRRHTRSLRDWSSDVCSSDLNFVGVNDEEIGRMATEHLIDMGCRKIAHIGGPGISTAIGRLLGYRKALQKRSEERRVGKECRYRWSPEH